MSMKLTDSISYAEAQGLFSTSALWALFDGTRERLNLAHECVDRHGAGERVAIRLAHPDGSDEALTFAELARRTSRFAHWLRDRGVFKGDRVAVLLPTSSAFHTAVFGTVKAGAIAVPLSTQLGSEGLRIRLADCAPRLIVTTPELAPGAAEACNASVVPIDGAFMSALARFDEHFEWDTASEDEAIHQYTSGTAKAVPTAVKHTHRAVVLNATSALYALGLRPGDRMFCPAYASTGQGLWHGVIAPLALGIETGTTVGRFDAERMCDALARYRSTAVTASPTHFRLLKNSGAAGRYRYEVAKLSYSGEAIDDATRDFIARLFRTRVCSSYGSTEVGAFLVCYPGAPDFDAPPGSLGRPIPGQRVEVQRGDGTPCQAREVGEIMLHRRGRWIQSRDRGWVDERGYFYYAGRADDAIVSAGWTMSPVDMENVLQMHPQVREAAVIGVPDATRGQIAKAFIVSDRPADEAFEDELRRFVKAKLSRHEYPRAIALLPELPRNAAGKVDRKALREHDSKESSMSETATVGRESSGASFGHERAAQRPLQGIRVVEACGYISGPWAATMLADLGAEVVKVEPPGGDPYRSYAHRKDGLSAVWINANRGKKGVTIDLKSAEGVAQLLQLLSMADVFIENWRPGVAASLGLDAGTVASANRRLIRLSITGFGETGPLVNEPAFDALIQGRTGVVASMAVQGNAGPTPFFVADKVTAVFAAQAILAALQGRHTTGTGSHIKLSMLDLMAYFNFPELFYHRTFVDDTASYRAPSSPVMQTRDGYIVLSPVSGQQLGRTLEVIGHPEWKADFKAIKDPVEMAHQFFLRLQPELRKRGTAEWIAAFKAVDVPVGPVLDADAHLADPQVVHNALYGTLESPVGPVRAVRYPALFDDQPLRPRGGAPALGEHNRELLGNS